ncbi:MAG: DEAD/DEAH box helicase family protein [Pseudomonadota bacterium]
MNPDRIRAQIKARLSLRDPQSDSLDILADLLENSRIPFSREDEDLEGPLAKVKEAYSNFEDFERAFPSFCFALATGVGKTRLMGAFITYLYLTKRSRNAFVLAPNTTIYEKLISDFDPKSPKYVFKGIAEFAQNRPAVVTGDNWDKMALDIDGATRNGGLVVNIFNVDKINKDKGRVKKLHEYLGQAYFEYLAELPDLVLLMDEAHRYRAKAGMKAVAELDPVIGLELTATPMSTGANPKRFKNVIYDYPLGQAMADGYVKEPAVATRSDFDPKKVTEDQLQRIKLEDGIHCHENAKAELEIYHRQTGKPLVHPFMLVVASDTAHAGELQKIMEADDFFGGRYKGRVIQIHSGLTGVETEEATQKLLAVEHDRKTDVVIHVNKLKEGWDVTNLYTIVPLRASASDILTEQTLGRGLRLPYGVRTGVEAIDTLTVIAHDRFQAIVDAARDPNSIVAIKKTVIIGGENGDVSDEGAESLIATSAAEAASTGATGGFGNGLQAPYVIDEPEEREAAQAAIAIIQNEYERKLKRGLVDLSGTDVKTELTEQVRSALERPQGELEGITPKVDVASVVDRVVANVQALTIEIPRIVILPKGEANYSYGDFDLTGLDSIAKQPISDRIMIQRLRDEARSYLARPLETEREEHPENYIIRHLLTFSEIDYDDNSELLYTLCNQMVQHLRSYLPDEEAVENVLLVHSDDLARFIFSQMEKHYREAPVEYEAQVTAGFTLLRPQAFKVTAADQVRNFKVPVVPAGDTRKHVFGGFRRCCYPYQKFDSDEERRFAVLIDSDNELSVQKWMKPGTRQFRIEYASGQDYEPDFVVETTAEKIIAEIKRRDEISKDEVQAKARAADKWIGYANTHARQCDGKLWTHALIPHDAVGDGATLRGLTASHARAPLF